MDKVQQNNYMHCTAALSETFKLWLCGRFFSFIKGAMHFFHSVQFARMPFYLVAMFEIHGSWCSRYTWVWVRTFSNLWCQTLRNMFLVVMVLMFSPRNREFFTSVWYCIILTIVYKYQQTFQNEKCLFMLTLKKKSVSIRGHVLSDTVTISSVGTTSGSVLSPLSRAFSS